MGEQRQAPAALPKGKRTCVHCTGSWVVLATRLDEFEKFRLLPGIELQTVQPVAQSLNRLHCPYCSKRFISVTVLFLLQFCFSYSFESVTVLFLLQFCICYSFVSVTVLYLLQFCFSYSFVSLTVLNLLQFCFCYSFVSLTVLFLLQF